MEKSPFGTVYGLYDPRADELRYIGQTIQSLKKRVWYHLSTYNLRTSTSYCARWLVLLFRLQLKPTIKVLGTASTREELDALEIKLIRDARARGDQLTNLADGGKSSSGYHLGKEFALKASERMLGVPKSAETRAKLSVANTGKKQSCETIRKRSATVRGSKRRDETKAKISLSMRGHTVKLETRRKISNSKKGKPSKLKGTRQTPEARHRNSLAHRGIIPSIEVRQKMSAAHKGKAAGEAHPLFRHDIRTELILCKINTCSTKRIAEGLGVSQQFINRRLTQARRAGISGVPASKRSIATSAILELRANGKTKKQIASELGLSVSGIAFRLRQARKEAVF